MQIPGGIRAAIETSLRSSYISQVCAEFRLSGEDVDWAPYDSFDNRALI